jgi:hypothetical protein
MQARGDGLTPDGLVFIDCEATSLARESYPVEVGLGWCGGRTESRLVRPAEAWAGIPWDPKSSAIHRISPGDLLTGGHGVREVAEWLNAACSGFTVCSDNPDYDGHWLGVLFTAARMAVTFRLANSYRLAGIILQEEPDPKTMFLAAKARVIAANPVTHRAGDDARFWAALFSDLFAARGDRNQG